jgi:hypothetical protein
MYSGHPQPEPTDTPDRSQVPDPTTPPGSPSGIGVGWNTDDDHSAVTCGHALALAGAGLMIQKICEILDIDSDHTGFDLDEVIEAVRDQRQRLVNRDTEAGRVRALLGMGAATPDAVYEAISRLHATDMAIALAQLANMPPGTPPEDALGHIRTAVEAFATPGPLLLPSDLSDEDMERFKRLFKASTSFTPEVVPRPNPNPTFEVIRQRDGKLAVLHLSTRMFVLQDADPEQVMRALQNFVVARSRDWLQTSLKDVLLGGEPWSVIRVAARREVLDQFRRGHQDHLMSVMTTIELVPEDRRGDVMTQRVKDTTQGGDKSSRDQTDAPKDLLEQTVPAKSIYGQPSTEASDLQVSDSILDHSRSEPLSSPDMPRITQQIFREPDARDGVPRFGIYDVGAERFVCRNLWRHEVHDHFAALVATDSADALRRRIEEALDGLVNPGYSTLVPTSEGIARSLRHRGEPPSGDILLTVDLTAPSAWEEPVELPDVAPDVSLSTVVVDADRRIIRKPEDDEDLGAPAFEVIKNASHGFILRNLAKPELGPQFAATMQGVSQILLALGPITFSVLVPRGWIEYLIRCSEEE